MLRTKCIFETPSKEDGLRVAVMSRLTKNDGKTPDPRIQVCDFHIPLFGPSEKLIGRYYKERWNENPKKQEEFKQLYLEELGSNRRTLSRIRIFASIALKYNVTFLCVEPLGEFCHRIILAEKCREMFPNLQVFHC